MSAVPGVLEGKERAKEKTTSGQQRRRRTPPCRSWSRPCTGDMQRRRERREERRSVLSNAKLRERNGRRETHRGVVADLLSGSAVFNRLPRLPVGVSILDPF